MPPATRRTPRRATSSPPAPPGCTRSSSAPTSYGKMGGATPSAADVEPTGGGVRTTGMNPITKWTLTLVTLAGLGIDAYVHFDLASSYVGVPSPSFITQY